MFGLKIYKKVENLGLSVSGKHSLPRERRSSPLTNATLVVGPLCSQVRFGANAEVLAGTEPPLPAGIGGADHAAGRELPHHRRLVSPRAAPRGLAQQNSILWREYTCQEGVFCAGPRMCCIAHTPRFLLPRVVP